MFQVGEFNTPILLNVFNRPIETEKVLLVLKKQKVPVLYIHCDGARSSNEKDKECIEKVKSIIDSMIDWPCVVHKMYETKNWGCGLGPYRAINWFFANEEQGIILEDDCLPHEDFFMYCQELLERYKDDSRVGVIAGTNNRPISNKKTYSFTAWSTTWGWATWRRIWKLYDFYVAYEDKDFVDRVAPFVKSKVAPREFLSIVRKQDEMDKGKYKSYWDYQLTMALLYNHKYNIRPSVNLISNIGFNERATHTIAISSSLANRSVSSILPLEHPEIVRIVSHSKDNVHLVPTFWKRIKRLLRRILGFFGYWH